MRFVLLDIGEYCMNHELCIAVLRLLQIKEHPRSFAHTL